MPSFRIDKPFHLRLNDLSKGLIYFAKGTIAIDEAHADSKAVLEHPYFKAMAVPLDGNQPIEQTPFMVHVDPNQAALDQVREATRLAQERGDAVVRQGIVDPATLAAAAEAELAKAKTDQAADAAARAEAQAKESQEAAARVANAEAAQKKQK